MKYLTLAFLSVLMVSSYKISAQDQVSDAELKKYAVVMDSVNDMRASLIDEIRAMVNKEGNMTSERYTELSKTENDEAKLAEVKATPEEIAFMKKVTEKKTQGTAEINKIFQGLAKNYVGLASYNKVKKALTTDTALKSKYETLLDELKKSGVN